MSCRFEKFANRVVSTWLNDKWSNRVNSSWSNIFIRYWSARRIWCDKNILKVQKVKMAKLLMRFSLLLIFYGIVSNAKESEICEQKKLASGHIRHVVKAQPDAWPWMAAIYDLEKNEYKFSGSLISKEHVLTGKLTWMMKLRREKISRNSQRNTKKFPNSQSRQICFKSLCWNLIILPQLNFFEWLGFLL